MLELCSGVIIGDVRLVTLWWEFLKPPSIDAEHTNSGVWAVSMGVTQDARTVAGLTLQEHNLGCFLGLPGIPCSRSFCEGEGDVVGVITPLGGVAQVIFHGVQVVEVGVQVRVHQDRGVEEDGEGQVEVEREVEEVREKRTYTWREDEMTDT